MFIQKLEDTDRNRRNELEIEEGKRAYVEADEYVLEFRKGGHLTEPREDIEYKDVAREQTLYQSARNIITDSTEFKSDYAEMHVGHPSPPPPTAAVLAAASDSQAYIDRTQVKEDANRKVIASKAIADNLYVTAEKLEEEVRVMAVKLDKTGGAMSFEARIKARKGMLAKKEEAKFLSEQATAAILQYAELKKEMEAIVYADTVAPLDFAEMEGIVEPSIEAWVICEPPKDGILDTVYYGAFVGGQSPPAKDWVAVSSEGEANPALEFKGPPARALKERLAELETREKAILAGETPPPPDENNKSAKTVLSWMVSGSSINAVNGRYIESGTSAHTFKFTNDEGLVLLKTLLKESPDLQITNATCSKNGVAGHDDDLGRKLTRIVALPDAEIETSDLAKNPADWGRDFNAISRAGLSMIMLGLKEKLRRKQDQKAENERRAEDEFNKTLKDASSALDTHDGDADASDVKTEKKKRHVDRTVTSLFPENISFQASDHDVALMRPGADKVINVSPDSVPPLCRAWVLLSCPKHSNHCKHRHYFCSSEEKRSGVEWRQMKDTKAEMGVLKCIAAREVLLKQITLEAERSSKRFFEDSEQAGVEEHHVRVLLTLLDRLRFVTVQTVETILQWRVAAESQASLRETDEVKFKKQTWVVTISTEGKRLYDASPAYKSNVKRFQRDREMPKKANDVRYLGVFPSKVEAARAYDAAMLQEAVRKGTTASRMPEKRFVLRACQKHYAVESVTSPKFRPCEQCAAAKYSGIAEYTPGYIWNGENYLLKISDDLEFLRSHEALTQWLGADFEFEGNPFMLAETVDSYVSMVDDGNDGTVNGMQVPETPMGSAAPTPNTGRSRPGTNDPNHLDTAAFSHDAAAEEVERIRATTAPFSFSSRGGGSTAIETTSDAQRPGSTNTTALSNSSPLFPETQRGSFGTPSAAISALGSGVNEWNGHTALGTRFVVDMPLTPSMMMTGEEKKDDSYGTMMLPPSPPASATMSSTQRVFEVLEISRIAGAWKVVLQETALNELLNHDDHHDQPLSSHPLAHLMKTPATGSRNNRLAQLKNQPGLVKTFAVYWDHGAMLSMEQQRKPLAHRDDQIWCRSDVGEWSGMSKSGKNMKTFEFGVKLKTEGRKKQAERTRVGAQLRREILKDISEVDIPKIKQLITDALELKGSRLKLDVETAEIFLKKYADWTRHANTLSRVIRGFLGRCKFSKRHKLIVEKYRERIAYMKAIASTAKNCVSSFVKKGSHAAARQITRPRHSTVQVMDGDHWLVALYSLEHHDYVHLSTDADRQNPSPADAGQRPKFTYDPESQTFKFYRGPFVNVRKRTPERILVKAYTGITGECLKMVIDSDQLRNRLHEQEICKLHEAGEQVSKACRKEDLIIDQSLKYGNPRYDQHNEGLRLRTYWEPIREARVLEQASKDATAASARLDDQNQEKLEYMREQERKEERMRENLEGGWMAFEDADMHVVTNYEEWQDAIRQTKMALEFSDVALKKMEDFSKPDWSQSWDPLENGNNWTQIVKKRNMERLSKASVEKRRLARIDLFGLYMRHATQLAKMRTAIRGSKQLENISAAAIETAKLAKYNCDIALQMADEVVHRIVSMMTVRVRTTVPISRRLIWVDRYWSLNHTPEARLKKEMLKNWNVLTRKTRLVYEPDAVFIKERKRGRYVITVLHDQFTGYLLIQAWCAGGGDGQNETPVTISIAPEEVIEILRQQQRADLCKPLVVKQGQFAYYNLRSLKAARQQDICEVLMNSLRLDTFRNTLTVGQLNFARVKTKLLSTLYDTLWWHDLNRKRSSGRGTKVFQEARKIGKRLVFVGVYDSWGDLLFECYESKLGQVYTLYCTMPEILFALKSNHAAVASYLTGVRINRYTDELMKVILDRLDFTLPGEEGRWWRQQLWNETPRLSLCKNHHECYRGPLYFEQRRVSGRTVVAKVMGSSRGDLRILVEKGEHGVEHSRYNGPPLTIDIDKEALRRIVREDMGLLKPSRKLDLYKFLFGKMELLAANDDVLRSRQAWKLAVEREEAGKERMLSSFEAHTKWAKLSNAPVMREVKDFVIPQIPVAVVPPHFLLCMKKDVDEDDQYEIVYEGCYGASESRHFTARICCTDTNEFTLSLKHETVFEKWGRFEANERELMVHEDGLSRKFALVEEHIESQAAVRYLKSNRESAKKRLVLADLRFKRKCDNMKKLYVKELAEQREKKTAKGIEDAKAAADILFKRVTIDGGGAFGKCSLLIEKRKGKKDIFQQRSFENHCVSESPLWSPQLVKLRSGVLPSDVGDNAQYNDLSKRRKKRKFNGRMLMGKQRFMGVSHEIEQSRAKVPFKWKVGKKVRKIVPSKRGVVVNEIVVKPRTMRLGGHLCTVWGELRRWLKNPTKLEISFVAYDHETSDSLGVAVRGPSGFCGAVALSSGDQGNGFSAEGLASFCGDVCDEVIGFATLKSVIVQNRHRADDDMVKFQEAAHLKDEQTLLRKVMMRMLNKATGAAWNQWVGIVRGMKQSKQAANVLKIGVDVTERAVEVQVEMRKWTEMMRKIVGVQDGEELVCVSACKAVYFSSKKLQDERDASLYNMKASQFASADGDQHDFYGPVAWAMLHGTKAMNGILEWDRRIVSSKVEGDERRREHQEHHEQVRTDTRGEFIAANIDRARRLMPHVRRACVNGDLRMSMYKQDNMVAYIHCLRKKADKAFPSERLDPYLMPEDDEEFKEEMARGVDDAFPKAELFRPWWVWSVCLRCHAQECTSAYMGCSVPFCGEARALASADVENIAGVGEGGIGGDDESSAGSIGSAQEIWKEHVWDHVGALHEEFHLEKEEKEHEARVILGQHEPMDPWERKQYILKQLKMTGRMMRGFFGARDAAQSRRNIAGAEGTRGWKKSMAEEQQIMKLHLMLPDRRLVSEAMGDWDDDEEAKSDDENDDESLIGDASIVGFDEKNMQSSLRLDKRVAGLLVGDGAKDGFGKRVEVGYGKFLDTNYLGDKELYSWLLSRLTLTGGVKDEDSEAVAVEEGAAEVEAGSVDSGGSAWKGAMGKLKGGLKGAMKRDLFRMEVVKQREMDRTEGLGVLSFSQSQCKGAVRISKTVLVMEVVQERPVKPEAGPGKVVTQEEIEDEEYPPLVITCGDPTTSGTFSLRLTQRALRGVEVLKGAREKLLSADKRPELAQFLVRRAGQVFALAEKQGRVQLCLVGESDEDQIVERLKSRDATLEKLALVKRSQEARKRKIQNECRVVRLEEFRVNAAKKRIVMEKKMLVGSVREWQSMHQEDVTSNMIRPYLTCDEALLAEVRIAFEVFDADGSGTISGAEFQALCFELGEIMDEKQAKDAMDVIDLGGDGLIQFHEFATWWVTDKPKGAGGDDSVNHKMLALKLKMLKRAKTVYGKMNMFPGVGKAAKRPGSKEGKRGLMPLSLKRGGAGVGVLGKIGGWFGGKGNRPKTV